jgi:hypothetical protein
VPPCGWDDGVVGLQQADSNLTTPPEEGSTSNWNPQETAGAPDPRGMSLKDYSLMREMIAAITEGLPDADQCSPGQYFSLLLDRFTAQASCLDEGVRGRLPLERRPCGFPLRDLSPSKRQFLLR